MSALSAVSGYLSIGPRFERWLLERVRRLRGPADLPLELE